MIDEIFNRFPKERTIEITLKEWKQILKNKMIKENLVVGYRFLFCLNDSFYKKKRMGIGDKAVIGEITTQYDGTNAMFTDKLVVIIPDEKEAYNGNTKTSKTTTM